MNAENADKTDRICRKIQENPRFPRSSAAQEFFIFNLTK